MSLLLGRLVAARRSDRTAARAVPLGYLGRLLRALEHEATAAAGRRVGIPGLVEALGERELEVLFDKLGAANRTEATARARELGLLADPAEAPPTSRP